MNHPACLTSTSLIEERNEINGLFRRPQKVRGKRIGSPARKIHDRIVSQLISFKENPRPAGVTKLRGRPGYRKRVGNYRILYSVDDENKRVEVVSIAHRKEVYR